METNSGQTLAVIFVNSITQPLVEPISIIGPLTIIIAIIFLFGFKTRKLSGREKEQYIRIVFLLALLISLGFYFFLYLKFLKPHLTEIILFLKIFIPILTIFLIIFVVLKLNKKLKNKQEKLNNFPSFVNDLEHKIREFKPLRKYNEEKLYQIELAGYLKNIYKDLDIEQQKDYSRPDIIIENIAIEIKGPTNMQSLKTIPDKINSYLSKRDFLIIVLFNIQIIDNFENMKIYRNKKQEILDNIVESKKNKVIFIEI